jgi:hypothetical protein
VTAIYEFTCFLRIPAEGAEEARERARALADAVCHGEATLALDDSEPSIDEKGYPVSCRCSREAGAAAPDVVAAESLETGDDEGCPILRLGVRTVRLHRDSGR